MRKTNIGGCFTILLIFGALLLFFPTVNTYLNKNVVSTSFLEPLGSNHERTRSDVEVMQQRRLVQGLLLWLFCATRAGALCLQTCLLPKRTVFVW